jgi:hypothetical protein
MPFAHDRTSPFPILRHATWKHLLRDLEKTRFGPAVKAASERFRGGPDMPVVYLLLAPVTALAYLIATQFPAPDRDRTVRITVFPGFGIATEHEGRWYRLLEYLLGDSLKVHVTIAPPLEEDGSSGNRWYPPSILQALDAIEPSESCLLDLDAYIDEGHAPDIVYFPFLPIASDYEALFAAHRLPELLARGSVLMGVNGASWAERDSAIALFEAHHLGQALSVEQPFGLASILGIPEDQSLARYAWVLRPSPQEVFDIQWGRIAIIAKFVKAYEDGEYTDARNPFAGQWLKLGQDPKAVLAGTRGRGINLKTREVYGIEYTSSAGYALELLGDAPNNSPMFEPEEGMSRMDLAIYADDAMGIALFPEDAMDGMEEFLDPDGPFGAGLVDDLVQNRHYTREQATAVMGSLAAAMTGKDGVEAGLPLFVAAAEDDAEAIRAAVAQRHDPNARDGQGWTPLCTAVDGGSKRAVKALLECGADVNAPTVLRWRPIDYALTRFHSDLAILLLEAGADIDEGALPDFNPAQNVLKSGQAPASVVAWLASHGKSR